MSNNVLAANDAAMPKSHREYKFGTFDERLDHFCALFEIDRPEFNYDEDGEPLLTDSLMEWVKEHKVNMDWLFAGSPCSMIQDFAKKRAQEAELTKFITDYDETEQGLLRMAMQAHICDGMDFDGAMQAWKQAMKEYRAMKAAA